nr:putative EpsG-like glucosyltransferase [Vibrio chagasii]
MKSSSKNQYFYFSIYLVLLYVIPFSSFLLAPFGRDFFEYSWAFENIDLTRFEPLFKLYFSMSYQSGINLLLVWFFTAIICLSSKFYIVYKVSSNEIIRLIFIISYVGSFFLLHELTQIRLAIGLTFALAAIYQLSKGNYTFYLFLLLISCLFHLSLIVLFPIFILYKLEARYGLSKVILLMATGCIALLSFSGMLTELVYIIRPSAKGYLENWHAYKVEYFSLSHSLSYGFCFFSWLYVKEQKVHVNTTWLLSVIFLVFSSIVLSFSPELAIRVNDIAAVFIIYCFASFPYSRSYKYILVLFFFALVVLYRVYGFIIYKPLFIL